MTTRPIHFVKMQGAGNDYVYIDCFAEPVPADPAALSMRIADRHFGVGGDGLVLVMPSAVAAALMRMFNADGSESEMFGNGVRCVAHLVVARGRAPAGAVTIETGRGVLTLDVMPDGSPKTLPSHYLLLSLVLLCVIAQKSGPTYSQCKPGEKFVDFVVGELRGDRLRFERGRGGSSAANKSVALGDVLACPHRLAVRPVEAFGDLLKCGFSAVLARVFDRDDVINLPLAVTPTMVLPGHSGLELLLEVHT